MPRYSFNRDSDRIFTSTSIDLLVTKMAFEIIDHHLQRGLKQVSNSRTEAYMFLSLESDLWHSPLHLSVHLKSYSSSSYSWLTPVYVWMTCTTSSNPRTTLDGMPHFPGTSWSFQPPPFRSTHTVSMPTFIAPTISNGLALTSHILLMPFMLFSLLMHSARWWYVSGCGLKYRVASTQTTSRKTPNPWDCSFRALRLIISLSALEKITGTKLEDFSSSAIKGPTSKKGVR